MARKAFQQVLVNGPLRSKIGVGDQVGAGFFAHRESPPPPLFEHVGPASCGFFGDIQVIVTLQ